jgi:hypothetical protein
MVMEMVEELIVTVVMVEVEMVMEVRVMEEVKVKVDVVGVEMVIEARMVVMISNILPYTNTQYNTHVDLSDHTQKVEQLQDIPPSHRSSTSSHMTVVVEMLV